MEDTRGDSVLGLQSSCKNQLFSHADSVNRQALARFALIGKPGFFCLKVLLEACCRIQYNYGKNDFISKEVKRMGKYTDDEIRGMKKITVKIAADYLGISPMMVSLGMRNNLLPIGFATKDEV